MPEELAIRCPNGPRRLFMKLLLSDNEQERPKNIPGLNLLELACTDCARARRKKGEDVFRVLHRYAIDGSLAESVIQYEDGKDVIESAWK